MKKVFAVLLFLGVWLYAAPFAEVKKVNGTAKVIHQGSIKKLKAKVGMSLEKGDSVITYRKAKVVLELHDKGKIVVDEQARLQLLSDEQFEQSGGKVYYKITKRGKAKGLKVNTPFAIIGVKGTEFVVTDSNKSHELALNEGLVGVDSANGKPFAHIDEDKVKAKMGSVNTPDQERAEFEAYKKELYAEFAEYVKEFDLKPGKKVRFVGNQAIEASQDSGDTQEFKRYMSDAEFNAVAKELEHDVTGDVKSEDELFSDPFFSDE